MDANLLASAVRESTRVSSTSLDNAGTVPCAASRPISLIQVKVIGEDDSPLSGIVVEVANRSQQVIRGRTSREGLCTIAGIAPGEYTVSLCELDKEAWELVRTESIVNLNLQPTSAAQWKARPTQAPREGHYHSVRLGECLAKIAYQIGFFPETIWQWPENEALKNSREDLHILAAGDQIYVPAKRIKDLAVADGTTLLLRRRGVPERLRVRFLDEDGVARAGLPFVLFVELADREECPARQGATDQDGFLDMPISPDATIGTLILDPGGSNEELQFDFSFLDPIDATAGLQARLNNLGYFCGDEDGVEGPLTRAALLSFQQAEGIPATGDADELSLKRLAALAMS